jgi:uncharacterized membrane protein
MSKFIQDLKLNVRSKTWWVTVISALIIILKAFEIDLLKYIGGDWENTLTTVFALLTAFGIHLNVSDNK